jgi:type I restriction enzyme S subunit
MTAQRFHEPPSDWQILPFDSCVLKDGVERKPSVQQNEYKAAGRFPIVDQGSSFIAGYTDDEHLMHKDNLPIILFGDHTRIFKFLDFSFATGADGTKLLRANEEIVDPRFLYYALLHLDIPSRGYNRHF